MDGEWRPSYDRARSLLADRSFEPAGYYLLHALARAPGEMTVIRSLVDAAREQAREMLRAERAEDALRRLEWAEGFVMERVPFVGLDDLTALLELAEGVRRERASVAPAADVDEAPDPEVLQDLRSLRGGALDTDVP